LLKAKDEDNLMAKQLKVGMFIILIVKGKKFLPKEKYIFLNFLTKKFFSVV